MRPYEMILILKSDLEEEAREEFTQKVKNLITERAGELVKEETWGKRKLAYEIKKHREGYYILFRFLGSADIVNELDRVLKLRDEALRHLVVKIEEAS